MDPDGKFAVSQAAFKRYCRTIQFEEDTHALWSSLDCAGEGKLLIEQFCIQAADVLAAFRSWAHRSFGSCVGLLETPEALKRRKQQRADGTTFVKASLSVNTFGSLLWMYGYPPLLGSDGDVLLWYITTTLDYHGGSLITFADLEWLDGWQPTAWLVAEPDEETWTKIRASLEEKYGSVLCAWRKELDLDNSNKLTWPEWCQSCHRLGITGNIAGAWRSLDQRRVGYVSLKEICKESEAILSLFKEWAETRFSSMQEAFRAMDADGGGSLSLPELKSACYKYKCGAVDPKLLFDVLSSNGRTISRKDFNFLNEFHAADEEAHAEVRDATAELWKEVFTAHQARVAAKSETPSWAQIRHRSPPARPPSRFGSHEMAAPVSCIPADFALGTKFLVSPYALPLKPKTAAARRTRLRRSLSDVALKSK
jgi:hypothetical protein